MLVIVLFLIIGVSLGLSAGKISALLKMNEGIFTLSIYSFLFMLAISVDIDDLIVRSLDNIGWIAFITLVGVIAAFMVIGWYLYKIIYINFKRKLSS